MSDLSQRIGQLSPERLALLSKLLTRQSAAGPQPQAIARRALAAYYPVSFAQERLWFTVQLEPTSPVYNIPIALEVKGALNVNALEQSFNEILNRHEVLRTTFTLVDGRPVQVIAPVQPFQVMVEDLRHGPASTRWAEATRLATEAAQQCFDLTRGPLLKLKLLRLAAEHYIILFTTHHIVCDEWSMGVLMREVVTLLKAFSQGQPSPLAELPIQYADYAVWERPWAQGEQFAAQLAYWHRQLADLPTLNLPMQLPRPAVQSFRGITCLWHSGPVLCERVKALSLRTGTTLFMTLLAAFKCLLYCYSGQSELVVGTDTANRNQIETEGLIGFFANQLVLRTALAADLTFEALLTRVRTVTLEAYAHQTVPFEQVVRSVNPQRDPSRPPLFQVKFVFQNATFNRLELPGLSLDSFPVVNSTAKFDLLFTVGEANQELIGSLEYCTDLFTADTIERFLAHFTAVLERVVEQSRLPLAAIKQILDEREQDHQRLKGQAYDRARRQRRQSVQARPIEVLPADLPAES